MYGVALLLLIPNPITWQCLNSTYRECYRPNELELTVAASRGAKGTVRGNSDSVQVSRVTVVVALELAVGKIPDFDQLIPARGNNDGVLSKW